MTKHTHRFGGQTLTHDHGPEQVRRDIRRDDPAETMQIHGYYGHIEDAPGEPVGAFESDLPAGYRWATAEETEAGHPDAIMVKRSTDSTGRPYTEDEADVAVPIASTPATCRYCGRTIELQDGLWVDPLATGDDSIWRETCDEHDTFAAEHEPVIGFTIDIAGEYGTPEGSIHLLDEHGEIVMWDSAEWVEDPSVVYVIAESIRLGTTEGAAALRERLGV